MTDEYHYKPDHDAERDNQVFLNENARILIWDDEEVKEYVMYFMDSNLRSKSKKKAGDYKEQFDSYKNMVSNIIERFNLGADEIL